MHRPRIGIPLCLDDRGRWRAGRDYAYADHAYAAAVDDAGGAPLFLPIQSSPETLVESIDGLLIPGGDDLPAIPELGEIQAAEELLDLAPERQIEFDLSLLEAARDAKLPIFGICYGMQLLARAAGGTLVTHLPSQRPAADDHKLPDWEARHPIEIVAESRFASILGRGPIDVNSLHHQAVQDAGPSFAVVARSRDGVIEAIESKARRSLEFGVQWHPEKMDDASSDRLFRAFIDASRVGADARETR